MPHPFLSKVLFVSVAAAVPTAGCSSASASPDQAANSVAAKLKSVSAVEFYFLSRTEDWNYSPDEAAAKSTVRAYRACGANCYNFMQPMLDHLRAGRPIKCSEGQENALIRAHPGVEIFYSFSGRQLRVADTCYFNERGISKVVWGDSMLYTSK